MEDLLAALLKDHGIQPEELLTRELALFSFFSVQMLRLFAFPLCPKAQLRIKDMEWVAVVYVDLFLECTTCPSIWTTEARAAPTPAEHFLCQGTYLLGHRALCLA